MKSQAGSSAACADLPVAVISMMSCAFTPVIALCVPSSALSQEVVKAELEQLRQRAQGGREMKRKTERERFETWGRRVGLPLRRILDNDDNYLWRHTQEAWLAWQAAKRAARRNER